MPTEKVGALVEGIPATLDGQPVYVRDALRTEINQRTDDSSFFAGGWFRNADAPTRFCVYNPPPREVDLCGNGFSLYDGRTGYWETSLSLGWPRILSPGEPYVVDRAVVLRVHEHDPVCTPEVHDEWPQLDCAHIGVLEGIAWLGPIETEPPTPTAAPTQPTDGLTRVQAIATARERIGAHWAGPLDLQCARLHVFSDVEHGLHLTKNGRNDPWVWAVLFRGGRLGYERAVLHYRSGNLLEEEGFDSPESNWAHC